MVMEWEISLPMLYTYFVVFTYVTVMHTTFSTYQIQLLRPFQENRSSSFIFRWCCDLETRSKLLKLVIVWTGTTQWGYHHMCYYTCVFLVSFFLSPNVSYTLYIFTFWSVLLGTTCVWLIGFSPRHSGFPIRSLWILELDVPVSLSKVGLGRVGLLDTDTCIFLSSPLSLSLSLSLSLILAASLPFPSRHFQTRSLRGWELFTYDLQKWH